MSGKCLTKSWRTGWPNDNERWYGFCESRDKPLDKSLIGNKLAEFWLIGGPLIKWIKGWLPQGVFVKFGTLCFFELIERSTKAVKFCEAPCSFTHTGLSEFYNTVNNHHLLELFRKHLTKCCPFITIWWQWIQYGNNVRFLSGSLYLFLNLIFTSKGLIHILVQDGSSHVVRRL